jgi:hypothetical protein
MNTRNNCSLGLITAIFVLCPLASALADDAGVVKTLSGKVSVKRGNDLLEARQGMTVQTSDQIMTGDKSTVGITLNDNTLLTAGGNAILSLDRFKFDPRTEKGELEANVKRGSLSVISGKLAKSSPENVQFKTASVTLGVRGTEFIIEVADR